MKIKVGSVYSTIEPEQRDWNKNRMCMRDLKNAFKAKIKNSYWIQKKSGWDGTIRFIDYNGRFRTGLLPSVLRWCKENGYRYEIKKPNGLDSRVVTAMGDKKLRSWQEDMLQACLKWKRGIINAATNAGKSFVFPFLVESYQNPKTLILTNRVKVMEAILENFETVGTINADGFNPANVTVAMDKSLLNYCNSANVLKYLNEVELLIVDECHWASGKGYTKLIDQIGAYHRFFFSGTSLDGKDEVQTGTLVGMAAPVIYQISNQDMIEAGQSKDVEVIIIENHCNEIKPYKENLSVNVKQSIGRLRGLTEQIVGKALILTQWTEHAELIARALKCEFTHSKDSQKNEKIHNFKQSCNGILVSTMIISEGVNIDGIDTVVWAGAGMSVRMIKQSIGRGLRGGDGKLRVIDFMDADGGKLESHSRSRINTYEKEGFLVTKK